MSNRERITKILRESINRDITRIAIFDFDGTLLDTPLPENGRLEYKEKTGKDWPYTGWWGRAESLDMDIFDMPAIPSVVQAYREEKNNPNTLLIMMTGRLLKFSNEVKKILDSKGLKFDVYEFNNGGSTIQSKINSLNQFIKEFPTAKSVSMWDDRVEHVDAFEAWGSSLDNVDFNITIVDGNHHKPE